MVGTAVDINEQIHEDMNFKNSSRKLWCSDTRDETDPLTQVAFWQVGQVLCMHIFCFYCFERFGGFDGVDGVDGSDGSDGVYG
jgi:hypothetical protein